MLQEVDKGDKCFSRNINKISQESKIKEADFWNKSEDRNKSKVE
jgi:hypothetical protein